MSTDFTSSIISWINAVQYRTLAATDPLVVGYNTSMNSGSTPAQIQTLIENDVYTTGFVNVVLREYQAAFGRVPDQAGAKFWVGQFATGAQSLGTIANVFASSAEFNSLYGAGPSTPNNLPLVTALYTNVLGRAPDAAGLNFWAAQPLNASQLLTQFAQSAEFIAAIAPKLIVYQNLEIAGTPPITGSFFSLGTTYTLTLNSDAIVGTGSGGDTINAPLTFNSGTGTLIQSLQTGDTVNETGTGNVFNATFNNLTAASISGITINGVQTYNLTNNGGAQAVLLGTFGGLTTLNNVASTTAGVSIGTTLAAGLNAALSTIGVTNTNTVTLASFSAAALAGANDTLTVNVNNAGTGTTAATVFATVAGLATANGYETYAFNSTGANFISLRSATAVNNTNNITFTGAGSITVLGDGTAGNFSKIATIDGSSATGVLNITGKLSAGFGLLTGDTVLTSIKTGTGDDLVDISSMTLANITANGTTVNLGTGNNTLMVDTTVATTAAALTGISNVQVLGVANAIGTIDMSKLPASVNTIKLANAQAGNLIINNGASGLTYDIGTFAAVVETITAAGAGTNDSFNEIIGTATAGSIGATVQTIGGYETINITSQGGINSMSSLSASASPGGSETLNIGGNSALTFAAAPAGLGIFLSGTNTTINVTDTAAVTISTPSNAGSTNAKLINAATSGGLLMGGIETGNSGSAGVTVIGSTVAGKGNVLMGSNGNDIIAGGAFKDSIVTNGGADQIALSSTHSGTHIGLYTVNNNLTALTPGAVQGALAASVTTSNNLAAGGFWGVAGGAAPTTSIFALFATGGTSADQSVVTGFKVASDVIDISLSSFASNGANILGLTFVNGAKIAAPGNAALQTVSSGGSLSGVSADLVVISGTTFSNAASLATALKTGTFALNFAAVQNGANFSHLLMAYNDSVGNGHIADVAINNASSAAFSNQVQVIASDMIQLTGVSVASLSGANVAFVA